MGRPVVPLPSSIRAPGDDQYECEPMINFIGQVATGISIGVVGTIEITSSLGEADTDKSVCATYFTSSVTTTNLVREVWPKEVVMAQSVASRPVAIRTRPMRGVLCRASRVHQRSPR